MAEVDVVSSISVILLVCSVGAATSKAEEKPLVFIVGRGDSVSRVVGRNANKVRAFIPRQKQWRRLTAGALVRQLLRENLSRLPHGIHTGNHVRISKDGRIEVTAGRGKPPQPFASTDQALKLARIIPEAVHDKIESLVHQGAVTVRTFAISEEGRRIALADRVYAAADGITFGGREKHFHVIGTGPLNTFNIAVWPFDGVPFSFPPNPFFRVSPTGRVQLKRDADAALARLIIDGELHPHEDHYHLSRKWSFEPWQKLVQLAADPDASRIRQQLAIGAQVALLKEELFIDSADFARDLAEIETRVARVWQGIAHHMSGQQMAFLVANNAAIEKDGKLLYIGKQILSAGEGLTFTVCRQHIHVRGGSDMGINVTVDPPKNGARLTMRRNIFVRIDGESVVAKQLDVEVVRSLQDGFVVLKHDDYHLTTKFHADDLAAIREVTASKELSRSTREAITKRTNAVLEEKLPIDTTKHFLAKLHRLGKKLETIRAGLPVVPPAPEPLETP